MPLQGELLEALKFYLLQHKHEIKLGVNVIKNNKNI